MTEKPMKIEGLEPAARALGVTVAEVRRAKRGGSPGFFLGGRIDVGEVGRWLASHPEPKARKRPPAPTDKGEGLALSLRRLERAEVEAHSHLLRCAGGEGEAEARKSWLAVSEQLRRSDETLAENRRDSGETLSRAEAERVLRSATWALAVTAPAIARSIAYQIAPERAGELTLALQGAMRNAHLSLIAVGTGAGALPPWAIAACKEGASAGLVVSDEDFEVRAQALGAVMKMQVGASVEAGLAEVAARVAEHEATQARLRGTA
jgi:hypothetical protein